MANDSTPPTAAEKYAPKVPPAVAKMAAQADELLRQSIQPPAGAVQNGDGKTDGPQVDDVQGGEQGGEQPQPLEQGGEAKGVPDLQAQPETQPEVHRYSKQKEPPAQELPLAAPGVGDESDNWQHRYDSMKGRYDRSQQQIQQLIDRQSSLEGVLAALQATTPSKPDDAKPKELPPKLITPEEENEYGKEFLEVVGKRAREEVNQEVNALKDELSLLRNQLTGVGGHISRTEEERVKDILDRDVPDWTALNNDPDFLAWLQTPDPYSGMVRQELLTNAYTRHDARRVVAFFAGFKNEVEATAPQALVQPQTPAGRAAAPPKVPLAKFAAPGRAKTAAPTRPVEQSIWSRADIHRFYQDVTAGNFRGREAEKDRIEQDLFAAQREGRTTP